jgi:peptide/nickel transport system substrate-binding protein
MRFLKAGAVLAAVTLAGALAACSSSSPSGGGGGASSGGSNATLTISNENGALWTCDFSPFNGSDTLLSVGFVYETLDYINPLQDGKITPMLASSYSWGAGDKSLTFTIRQGVKFSNGTPLSAKDVAYTFNLLKKYPALDLTGVWSVLSSVTQTGADQVTLDFSAPAVPWFYYIADQVPIVSEAIWSKVANPVAYPDTHPVGTGPYLVNPCTSANITYTANPLYWQAGEPHVKKIEYPAFTSNNTANDELATGQAQWGAQYIPSIASFYTAKSPLLSNVKVRQAISYAIDRSQVSSLGESGYEPPANQTGIVTPTFSSTLDNSLVASYGNSYDPAKAKQLLEQAGYKLNSAGVMTNAAGQSLSFTVINIGDYSDWVADMQVIAQDLKAVGIVVTPDNLTNTDFDSDLYYGKYQLAFYDQQTFGPSPYYELNNWLNSADTAPIGKVAATNYERYSNPATEALLNAYAGTTSTATQQSIMDQIQQVMVSDVPIIPVVEAVDWYQYDTAAFSGWPTSADPYAQPSAYAYPDMEQVLLHLQPK